MCNTTYAAGTCVLIELVGQRVRGDGFILFVWWYIGLTCFCTHKVSPTTIASPTTPCCGRKHVVGDVIVVGDDYDLGDAHML